MKFEEKVEEGGERWSKPHVSTLSLHSLFELRTCLQTGTVLLDLDGYSLPQIVGEDVCFGSDFLLVYHMLMHDFRLLPVIRTSQKSSLDRDVYLLPMRKLLPQNH